MDQRTLDVRGDFGMLLHFEAEDASHLPLNQFEDRKLIRNYAHVVESSEVRVSLYEMEDGRKYFRLHRRMPTFDSGDRTYDSWHILYLVENPQTGRFDGVFATGGYVVAKEVGYKGLTELPEVLAALPMTPPPFRRVEKEEFDYVDPDSGIVYRCRVDDTNTSVTLKRMEAGAGGKTSIRTLRIPEEIEAYPVERLTDSVLEGLENLVELQLPGTIYGFPVQRLSGCPLLERIAISGDNPIYRTQDGILYGRKWKELLRFPAGRKERSFRIEEGTMGIGDGAFAGNKNLEEVFIPESVKKVGREAFAGCTALKEVVLPDEVKFLRGVFSGCTSLKKVHLPKALSKYGFEDCFRGCTSLEKIDIPEDALDFTIIDGALYSRDGRGTKMVFAPEGRK